MKREFRNENFEDFLKRNADNLRMKAPERVWENLSKHLNKKRRRFSAGLSAFLLFTGLLGYLTISTTTKQLHLSRQQENSRQKTAAIKEIKQEARVDKIFSTKRAEPVVLKGNVQKQKPLTELPNVSSLLSFSSSENAPAQQSTLKTTDQFTPTVIDDNPEQMTHGSAANESVAKPAFLLSRNATPLSIESVVNSYKPRKSRFQTEFHFTPTISYRKLSENKSYLRNATLITSPPNYAALYGSVNSMVTHKPDLGFELGITEKYSLTQKLRVRAGLQFNVNRYDIKAFNAPYSFATIALRNRTSAGVDSIWALTNYSNVDANNNKTTNWLQNFSFQASAPIGVELDLAGNEKMKFGIATTVQPTYVLGDRAYLITTNYKSYTQVPWLLRRWNVNTAFETFVSYQSGKARWQVGPQVRYQLLSSFISNYPVKENLFDFGLKIGLSINK